jgi:HSP20 family protein
MTIARFNPETGVLRPDSFSTLLDRFFNETVNSSKLAGYTPRVDVWETENGYFFEMALPGLREEDIQIDFQEGRLTISGERKFEKEESGQRYHLLETQYGAFNRTFNLPDNVNPEKIEAYFEQGMLKVNVPKDEKKTQKHQIRVNGGREKSLETGGKTKANGQTKDKAAI